MCYPTHLFPLNLYIFLDFWGHGHMFLDSITPLPPIFSYRSLTPYYTLFTQIFVFMKETLEIIVFKMLKMNSQNRPKKPGAPNLLYKYYMRNYGLTFQMSYSVPIVYTVYTFLSHSIYYYPWLYLHFYNIFGMAYLFIYLLNHLFVYFSFLAVLGSP